MFISTIVRPVIRAKTPTRFNAKWTCVPFNFCLGVWVGCKMRMACVRRRIPAELTSWEALAIDCEHRHYIFEWLDSFG